MTYEQLIRDLKSKSFKPIYFLHGDEPYYIDLVTDYITSNVLTEAEKSFNQTIVYGKDSDAGTGDQPGQTLSHDVLPPGGGGQRSPGAERF